MLSLDKLTDVTGYLVLNEDGAIISSGGDLENSEQVANRVITIISLTDRLGPDDEIYKKISVTFKDCSYVICLSNKKTFIVKKNYHSPPFNSSDEDFSSDLASNAFY